LGLYLRSAGHGRLRHFSAHVVARDALHDGVLLCDEGIFAVVIAKQATFELGLDPALKLFPRLMRPMMFYLLLVITGKKDVR
jgi:hypothetical protein